MFSLAGLILLALTVLGQATAPTNVAPPQPLSTICGEIVANNTDPSLNQTFFYARDALACLTSVPFNAAVATRFLQYYNQTMSFQSSLAYLRNPPAGYKQPAVNFLGELQQIQSKVDQGYYLNQYAFEAELQDLVTAAHDSHVQLYAGVLNQFTFSSPYFLSSVSKDGKEAPKVYFSGDLYGCNDSTKCGAIAISTINNIDVTTFLSTFAAQQVQGYVDPEADWNDLMYTPTQDVLGIYNTFTGLAPIYPGDEIIFGYEDGTNFTDYWLAIYNSPGFTGPLTTGGDFYNFFGLGLVPANYEAEYDQYYGNGTWDLTGLSSDNTTVTSWYNVSSGAYPDNPIIVQADLGLYGSGIVTGYLLNDTSTAVLSIPSFVEYDDGVGTFSTAVSEFVTAASNAFAKQVIIDLQQNSGGNVALAFDTFRYFFPNRRPFAGSRMRSHYWANVLGSTLTGAFQLPQNTSSEEYETLVGEEWVVADRINAENGQNFSSWAEFYGPRTYNGGKFSLVERYNISDVEFDDYALDITFPEEYTNGEQVDTGYWDPESIVILTDGICGSTCSLFVEMLVEVGVRTVVVGGRPDSDPMQYASGSRGAAAYSGTYLDADFALATDYNDDDSLTNNILDVRYNTGMDITQVGFTLRDQIRKDQTTPNQFLYLPADCRIYWTFANLYNYTQLWSDVWYATWSNPDYCVAGATNSSSTTTSSTSNPVRRAEAAPASSSGDLTAYILEGLDGAAADSFHDDPSSANSSLVDIGTYDGLGAPPAFYFCTGNNQVYCSTHLSGSRCAKLRYPCAGEVCLGNNCGIGPRTIEVCVRESTGSDSNCGFNYDYRPQSKLNTHINAYTSNNQKSGVKGTSGLCYPRATDGGSTCKAS